MRVAICLLVGLLVPATGHITFDWRGDAQSIAAPAIQSDAAPKVMNARLNGKKLIVTGENFAPNALIFINGEKQKTQNDSDNPSTMLIAKKAGKKMPAGAVVKIQVLNPAGSSSTAFDFFSGRTVTIDDGGKTIELQVGERFLLVLKKENFDWLTTVQDPAILKKITDVDVISGAQGIFEAERAGRTKVLAQGNPSCAKSTPPCRVPSILFELNIIVE